MVPSSPFDTIYPIKFIIPDILKFILGLFKGQKCTRKAKLIQSICKPISPDGSTYLIHYVIHYFKTKNVKISKYFIRETEQS